MAMGQILSGGMDSGSMRTIGMKGPWREAEIGTVKGQDVSLLKVNPRCSGNMKNEGFENR